MKIRCVKWLFFLPLLIAFLPLHAQQGWQLGVSGQGFNYWLYNEVDKITPPVNYYEVAQPVLFRFNGWGAGLTAAYFWNDWAGVQSELGFSSQKMRYFEDGNTVKEDWDLRLQYLHVPAFFALNITPESAHQLFILAGPQISALLVSWEKSTFHADFPEGMEDLHSEIIWKNKEVAGWVSLWEFTPRAADLAHRRLVFGAAFAIGYQFSFDDWGIRLGFRGSYDFTDAENKEAKWYYTEAGEEPGFWDSRWYYDGGRHEKPSTNIRAGVEAGAFWRLGR